MSCAADFHFLITNSAGGPQVALWGPPVGPKRATAIYSGNAHTDSHIWYIISPQIQGARTEKLDFAPNTTQGCINCNIATGAKGPPVGHGGPLVALWTKNAILRKKISDNLLNINGKKGRELTLSQTLPVTHCFTTVIG